jgi:hypothetical protein
VLVQPAAQTIDRGTPTYVRVVVQEVAGLGAYQLTLSYDPDVVTALAAANETFLGSTGRPVSCPPPSFAPGEVTFGCFTIGSPPPNGATGNGVLAGFTFAATCGGGSSAITLAEVTLADALGNDIGQQHVKGGSISIDEGSVCPSPEPDADLDGCPDAREQGSVPQLGGMRDPQNFWDFFDTPAPGGIRDRVASVADISRVVARFGSSGPAVTIGDALAMPPPAPAYHAGFDRTPSITAGQPWRTRAANGSVTVQDVTLAVASFGHSCA